MVKEFKKFAMKGNIMDLAIGVVIGGAFQSIVNSLVKDIIMPIVSLFTGKIDFSNLKITVEHTSINYGNFITAVVNFLIMAFTIFLMVRYINKAEKLRKNFESELTTKFEEKTGIKRKKKKKKEVIEEPETKICPYCYTEINYKATRCPNCTSKLEVEKKEVKKEVNEENKKEDTTE